MRKNIKTWRLTLGTLFVSVVALAAASLAYSQVSVAGEKATAAGVPAAATPTESQVQAGEILMRMAKYLGGAQRFSVTVHGGYDALQESGQKIEYGENRKITLNRPNQLRVEGERSDGAKTLTVFDGKEITLIDAASNVYAQDPQPGSVDDAIVHFVKDLGMKLPMSALLLTRLPEELKNRVQTVDYVEMTNFYGSPSHHLAARTDTMDFQVWVADGDKPFPLRVVLSYRQAPGHPQFWAQFSDWNLKPVITKSTFSVKVPDGAQKIAFAAKLPRLTPANRKPSEGKGGAK